MQAKKIIISVKELYFETRHITNRFPREIGALLKTKKCKLTFPTKFELPEVALDHFKNKAKLIELLYILEYRSTDHGGRTKMTTDVLSKLLKCSPRSIYNYIKTLEDFGYIMRETWSAPNDKVNNKDFFSVRFFYMYRVMARMNFKMEWNVPLEYRFANPPLINSQKDLYCEEMMPWLIDEPHECIINGVSTIVEPAMKSFVDEFKYNLMSQEQKSHDSMMEWGLHTLQTVSLTPTAEEILDEKQIKRSWTVKGVLFEPLDELEARKILGHSEVTYIRAFKAAKKAREERKEEARKKKRGIQTIEEEIPFYKLAQEMCQ